MAVMKGLFTKFYKQNPIEQLMQMSDEDIDKAIDEYLDNFMSSWQKRNPGQKFPEVMLGTINDIRNKKTNVSKVPRVIKTPRTARRNYNDKGSLQ